MDSVRAETSPRRDWRQARLAIGASAIPGAVSTRGRDLDRSPDRGLREYLEWRTGLRRLPGPADHAPDPLGWGDLPAREPVACLVEGFPAGPWANPDPPPEPVTPLWLDGAVLLPADPLLLPSNAAAGPILLCDLTRPDSARTSSAARLTSGSGGSYTEEFFFARPGGAGLLRLGYGDAKTEGRFGAGIFQQFGENLLARYDRATASGGWSFGWQQGRTRVRPEYGERYLHDRVAWEAGLLASPGGWTADLGLGVSWERLAHEGEPLSKRKEALRRAFLRLEGPGERLRPLVTLQWDHLHRRFYQPGAVSRSEDLTRDGPAVAAGVAGSTAAGSFRASLGWARITPFHSGWTAAATLSGSLAGPWRWTAHLDRVPRAPLVPRLAGDLSTPVGQGLWLAESNGGVPVLVMDARRRPEVLSRIDLGLERPTSGEVAGRAGGAERRAGLRLRLVEVAHGVVPRAGEITWLVPGRRAGLPASALDRRLRMAALHGEWRGALPFGFALEARAAWRTARPGWRTQLWMTPFDARAQLTRALALFRGDLKIEGFLRGDWSGRRGSPAGILPPSDRYDAGLTAGSGPLTLLIELVNLESDETAAADLILPQEVWTPLPLRTYRLGLTWRFLD